MPIYQEATFHDRQCINNEAISATTSTMYVDLPGAVINTKSLAQPGHYMIMFSALMNASLNNTVANFRILINGNPINVNGINVKLKVKLKVKDLDVGYTVSCVAESVPENAEIRGEYKTDKGTLTVEEFNLLIDGVPPSRVVE